MVWGFKKYDGTRGLKNFRNYEFTTLQRNIGRYIVSPFLSRRNFPTRQCQMPCIGRNMDFFGKLYGCGDRLVFTVSGFECYREFVGNSEQSGPQKESEEH